MPTSIQEFTLAKLEAAATVTEHPAPNFNNVLTTVQHRLEFGNDGAMYVRWLNEWEVKIKMTYNFQSNRATIRVHFHNCSILFPCLLYTNATSWARLSNLLTEIISDRQCPIVANEPKVSWTTDGEACWPELHTDQKISWKSFLHRVVLGVFKKEK